MIKKMIKHVPGQLISNLWMEPAMAKLKLTPPMAHRWSWLEEDLGVVSCWGKMTTCRNSSENVQPKWEGLPTKQIGI